MTRADRLTATGAIVDGHHAEWLRIEPRRKERHGGAVADPDRPVVTVPGVLTVRTGEYDRGGDAGDTWFGVMPADRAEAHIRPVSLPGYPIHDGDHIVALDRDGEPAFEVNRVDRRRLTRVVLQLTPIG